MPVLDDATQRYLLSDKFAARAKSVRQRLESNERLSLGEIADALGLDFNFFAQQVAAEVMAQDRTVVGVFVDDDQAPPTDAKALFHADHANIGAGDVNVDNVSVGRLAMRQQKDKAGFRIAVAPKFLVVSAENETDAEKFLAEISPAKVGDVQPIKLALVVEPRLSMLPWYLVDPAVDGLVTAYLAGEPGPQVESRAGFDVDGVETKVRLDFGCAFTDWRGWYKSSGV